MPLVGPPLTDETADDFFEEQGFLRYSFRLKKVSVGPMTTRAICVDDMSGERFEWRWVGHKFPEWLDTCQPTVTDVRLTPVLRDDGLQDHDDSDDELAIQDPGLDIDDKIYIPGVSRERVREFMLRNIDQDPSLESLRELYEQD
jgi:hypothetical protein